MHGRQIKTWGKHWKIGALAALFLVVGTLPTFAQGPDVIVGNLTDISNYGQVGGIYAYAVGTESCNIGNVNLSWIDGSGPNGNQHPVIPQDMYKLMDGRFTHIGASWLKHGFCALSLEFCGPCNGTGTGCDFLGVGCSDPYGSGLNGSQGGLGPRSQVNAHTGAFPYPFSAPPFSGPIARRMQVAAADLTPALNPGALYFVSSHYVTPDDAAAGNGNNNASYRRVSVGANTTNHPLSFIGATQQEQPPIQAWQDFQPSVTLVDLQIPNEGLFIVGYDVTDNGNGTWSYEYAVYNMNSDRSAQSFTVPLPTGISVTNAGFRDIEWHSGEPYSTVDWPASINPGTSISWAGETFAQNQNANAIRWSMLYNFYFTADAPPSDQTATIGLFKPGTPTELTFTVSAPSGNFIQSVNDFTCTQSSPTSANTTLSWTNPESYSSIVIRRNGAMLTTTGGGATSFTDTGAGYGTNTYTVQGVTVLGTAAEVPCTVTTTPVGVSALTCTQSNPDLQNVTLNWSNGTTYQSINVRRDGLVIASLAGSMTTYSDNGVALGSHFYEVSGVSNATESTTAGCTVNVTPPPPLGFAATAENATGTFDSTTGAGSATVSLVLSESGSNSGFPNDVTGFSLGFTCDAALVTPAMVTQSPTFTSPEFFASEVLPNGGTVGVVMSIAGAGTTLQLTSATEVALFDLETNPGAFAGQTNPVSTSITFQDGLGTGAPIENLIVVGFDTFSPTLVSGLVTLNPIAGGLFIRGDTNDDGDINIADAISALGYLFSSGPAGCLVALDANDDGAVDIADPISILGYLFSNEPAPSAPFPGCGVDPTPDTLDCASPPSTC